MHVLIFAPFAVTEYHFATDLEIAQQHLDSGDRVTIAVCNADLLTCESNSDHDLGRCIRCIGSRLDGIARLSPRPEVISFVRMSAADREELRNINVDGMTPDGLRNVRFDNFDVGWAVRSSLITAVGTSDFPFEQYKSRVQAAMRSALSVSVPIDAEALERARRWTAFTRSTDGMRPCGPCSEPHKTEV